MSFVPPSEPSTPLGTAPAADVGAPCVAERRTMLSHGGEFSVPARVQSWYPVCRSAELRPGAILTRDFLGRSIVVFRTRSGAVHALAAHCWHMGTHLGRGTVEGERIRCPLHHWESDGRGVCRRAPGLPGPPGYARQLAYPAAERYGAIFLFNG